jgi:hypothetical protein
MFHAQTAHVHAHTATIIADAEHGRMVSRARKVRKRDGRTEQAEAGAPRPPAVDC